MNYDCFDGKNEINRTQDPWLTVKQFAVYPILGNTQLEVADI